MRPRIVRLVVCAAVLAALLSSAAAAPPGSCASKFVGTWIGGWGSTQVVAGGTAYPKCPMCVPVQTWTCSGNTFMITGPTPATGTLMPDGRTMTGSWGVATRVGGRVAGAASPDKPAPVKQTARQEPAQPQPQTARRGRQQANCSDITGTKGGGKLQVNCTPAGGQKLAAAPPPASAQRPAQTSTPQPQPQPQPQSTPHSGAPSADRQAALAGTIIDELGRIRSGQIPPQPMTGAANPLPDPNFNPRQADPHRPPETLPVDGQPCVTYFQNMKENFKRRAALCLRDTRLLRSLTDMVESNTNTSGTEYITRNTAPELFAYFDDMDPRWVKVGEHARMPNCSLPMTVAAQNEAFMECARVYMCGMRAASCGMERARQSDTNQCIPISRQCLAENPIPQQMTADPTPSYQQPPPSPQLPIPPHRNSTITGPSGPGGGSTSGGVMSAQ
jgi:hypothetical protein